MHTHTHICMKHVQTYRLKLCLPRYKSTMNAMFSEFYSGHSTHLFQLAFCNLKHFPNSSFQTLSCVWMAWNRAIIFLLMFYLSSHLEMNFQFSKQEKFDRTNYSGYGGCCTCTMLCFTKTISLKLVSFLFSNCYWCI